MLFVSDLISNNIRKEDKTCPACITQELVGRHLLHYCSEN